MAAQNEHADPSKLAAALRRLRRVAELLRRALARGEEHADILEQDLIALAESILSGGGAPKPASATLPAPLPAPTKSTFLLQLAAKSGVEKLEIERLSDGAAWVRIDGGKALRLPPTLVGLLETLAFDPVHDVEQLVGWKSREEVRAGLQKRIGRKFSRHAIDELLRRLRAALAAGGVNPFLVQTHRQFGLRFALRRARNCDEP